jgi:hypothetical protein
MAASSSSPGARRLLEDAEASAERVCTSPGRCSGEKCNKELGSVVIASVVALAGMADPGRLGFRGPRLVEVRGTPI